MTNNTLIVSDANASIKPKFRTGLVGHYRSVHIGRFRASWDHFLDHPEVQYAMRKGSPVIRSSVIAGCMGVSEVTARRYRQILDHLDLALDVPGYFVFDAPWESQPAELHLEPDASVEALERHLDGVQRIFVAPLLYGYAEPVLMIRSSPMDAHLVQGRPAVLAAITGHTRLAEIIERVGVSKMVASRHLNRLMDDGEVVRVSRGVYARA